MKFLGGCDSFKKKYKLEYQCCSSCHNDDWDGYPMCECETKDGYYSVCCNYIDPTEEVEK